MNGETTFKKGLYGLILLLFALSASFVISNYVYAADSNFVVDENGVITKYYGILKGTLVIPSEINGVKITSIGTNAFNYYSDLVIVEIPEGVISIGQGAFRGCTSLASITIPESVTSIGENAFDGCTDLKGITIPNKVLSIGKSAFNGCSSLTDIKIPQGITSIEDGTFGNCTNLKSVTLPESLTTIGRYAFDYCSSLKNITIPKNVTHIWGFAFYGCSSLIDITIPDKVTSIMESTFSFCTNLKDVTIHENVTNISYFAFYNCTSLTSIIIPKGVTYIDYSVFDYCTNLESVYIYNKYTKIIDEDDFYKDRPICGINNPLVTLYGLKDSTTEDYAKKWNYKFQPIEQSDNPLINISLKEKEVNLTVGESVLNELIYNPTDTTDDKTVTWSSSNPNVATVASNGKITGVNSGSANITAKVGKFKATCTVIVKDESKLLENKIYFSDDYDGKTVTKDETIRIPINLSTIKDYYALDSSIKYDKTKLEFIGYSINGNYKDCYADSSDVNMLRFILASKGKKYPIKTSDDPIIYLNFKCIATGDTNVIITSTTLANLDEEITIKTDNLDKTTIHITNSSSSSKNDINRDGKFSLIDLAVDAYYYGVDAVETDKTKYDADIIPDGKIDDLDLMEITKNIINN